MSEQLKTHLRTHTCGELKNLTPGAEVSLCGWFTGRRVDADGGVRLELSDRFGSALIHVLDAQKEAAGLARQLQPGDVLRAQGIAPRGGLVSALEVRLLVSSLTRFSSAEALPVPVYDSHERIATDPELALRYRYLELRRPEYQRLLEVRSRAATAARNHLIQLGFLEIETPLLEAWDRQSVTAFIVPFEPGRCFALPQNPQARKQLLMIGACDRYFQLARCFRRETELSADRKLEFTTLDLELSFVDQADVFATVEGLIGRLWKGMLHESMPADIPRLTYDDALVRYGTDRPDLRFELPIADVTDLVSGEQAPFVRSALEAAPRPGGAVRAFRLPEQQVARLPANRIELLGMMNPDPRGVKLSWVRLEPENGLSGPGAVAFPPHLRPGLLERVSGASGDILVLFAGGDHFRVAQAAGDCRLHMGKELELIDPRRHALVWITDYPYFGYDAGARGYLPVRHPFTQPTAASRAQVDALPPPTWLPRWDGQGEPPTEGMPQDRWIIRHGDGEREALLDVRAQSYDLVLNGVEIGTGSMRNHELDLQQRVFSLFGYSRDTVEERFAPLLEAMRFGVPPHGGIALGFDRLLATLIGIRDIDALAAFPKDSRGHDPLFNAPSSIDPALVQGLLDL